MKSIEVPALFEHWTQPEGGDAEPFEVVKLGLNALERPALPAIGARVGPLIPTPGRAPRTAQVLPVQQRAGLFLAVAEAIYQKKVEYLISPVHRGSSVLLTPGQRDVSTNAVRSCAL